MSLNILGKPGLDPHKFSTQRKIDLIHESNGLLIDLLKGETIDNLNFRGYTSLTHLPNGLTINRGITLSRCPSLIYLPDDIKINGYLNLSDCTSLTCLPQNLKIGRWLNLEGCTSLTRLPDGLEVGEWLNLKRCTSLKEIPSTIKVEGIILTSGSFE